jgi:hypothetical protein
MAFQQSSIVDLVSAIVAAGLGGIAIRHGYIGLGLVILAITGFGVYATIVEMLEGRS